MSRRDELFRDFRQNAYFYGFKWPLIQPNVTGKTDIRDYYNAFSKSQGETGVNLRHYYLIDQLRKAGLKKSHHVLEVGCGIGTLTGLLASFLTQGKLVAADISDVSVDIARKRLGRHKQLSFVVTDMSDVNFGCSFDFVVLPDVMEHIPVEQHRQLFAVIAKHLREDGMVFIHVPHPLAIDYYRKHKPEVLQIVDQALGADRLIADAYANGLMLQTYRAYSLFHDKNDYVLITFRKGQPVMLQALPKLTVIWRKLKARTAYLFS